MTAGVTLSSCASSPGTIVGRDPGIFGHEGGRHFLEHLPVAIVVMEGSENPRTLFLSRHFTGVFGYTLEDIPTQEQWAELAVRDTRDGQGALSRWKLMLKRALTGEGLLKGVEMEITAKDGARKRVILTARRSGECLQVVLTEARPVRDAERSSCSVRSDVENRAYEVTEMIPAGLYSMVLHPGEEVARYTFMSSRFLEICGLDRRVVEADPREVYATIHPEDRAEWIRKKLEAFENHLPFSGEARLIVRGELRWIHAESVPYELPDGTVVRQGLLRDITTRKLAEIDLAALHEEEKRTEARRRERLERRLRISLTTSVMAHDLAQPLSRIGMALQLEMERERREGNGGMVPAGLLESIAEDFERVSGTVQRMRMLMRSFTSEVAVVDLWDVVENSLLTNGALLRKQGIECITQPPSQSCRIAGDPEQVHIALNNVICNAVEALSAEDGLERPPRIRVALFEDQDSFQIVVGDSGPGLAADFVDLHLLESSKRQGLGLGLFIVVSVMENHHGKLKVGVSPLGGAELRMIFPKEGGAPEGV
jgi:signal transduction histidine kinase